MTKASFLSANNRWSGACGGAGSAGVLAVATFLMMKKNKQLNNQKIIIIIKIYSAIAIPISLGKHLITLRVVRIRPVS